MQHQGQNGSEAGMMLARPSKSSRHKADAELLSHQQSGRHSRVQSSTAELLFCSAAFTAEHGTVEGQVCMIPRNGRVGREMQCYW